MVHIEAQVGDDVVIHSAVLSAWPRGPYEPQGVDAEAGRFEAFNGFLFERATDVAILFEKKISWLLSRQLEDEGKQTVGHMEGEIW